MSVGRLFQYKEEFYARFHQELPRFPFAPHSFLTSHNTGLFNLYKSSPQNFNTLSAKVTAKKKYILFCAGYSKVSHPKVPSIGCSYLKCLISDPYMEGDSIDGWVRDEWVEPLDEFSTYYENHLITIRNKLQILSSKNEKVIPNEKFSAWAHAINHESRKWNKS